MMEYLLQAGVKTKQCCVPYCKDNISKRHRFPKGDENIFNKWVNNVRHPKFEGLNKDQIYRSYYVCDRHFEEEFKVPGTKRGLLPAFTDENTSTISENIVGNDTGTHTFSFVKPN
jgi:hypothetical protein